MPSPAEAGRRGACSPSRATSSRTSSSGRPSRCGRPPTPRPGSSGRVAAAARTWPPLRRRSCRRASSGWSARMLRARASRRPRGGGRRRARPAPGRTGTVVLLVDPRASARCSPTARASPLSDVDPAWLDGVAWLHLPAYGLEREPMRSELRPARGEPRGSAAPAVSIDASSTGLLAGLGVELGARPAPRDRARRALRERVGGVAARYRGRRRGRGIRGAHGRREARAAADRRGRVGELVARVDVAPVPGIRDLTGAGDAFAAGFLAATLGGRMPRRPASRGMRARHPCS